MAEASAIYDDDEARYTAFAEAERILIDHAIIVPYSISLGDGYVVSKLNPLEGEYAPYGVATERYKYQHLGETSMSMDEFKAAMQQWEEERTASLAAEAE